jgi:hypothetical protein
MGSMNRRGQNGFTGFVLFMKRKDAEKAVQELEGINWGGTVLKLGWSRPMPLPPRAAYGRSPEPSFGDGSLSQISQDVCETGRPRQTTTSTTRRVVENEIVRFPAALHLNALVTAKILLHPLVGSDPIHTHQLPLDHPLLR